MCKESKFLRTKTFLKYKALGIHWKVYSNLTGLDNSLDDEVNNDQNNFIVLII